MQISTPVSPSLPCSDFLYATTWGGTTEMRKKNQTPRYRKHIEDVGPCSPPSRSNFYSLTSKTCTRAPGPLTCPLFGIFREESTSSCLKKGSHRFITPLPSLLWGRIHSRRLIQGKDQELTAQALQQPEEMRCLTE